MKHLCLILLSLAIGLQQASQSTSGLEVLKFRWTKERIGWERDPFSGPIENFDEVRARTRNEKRIEDAKRGNSAEVDKIKREAKADAANIEAQHKNVPSRYVFVYKTTIKNTGPRTVKSIDWDYIFLDRSNNAELGRQQFTSDERILPGKTKELVITITKPPTHTISVTALNKSEGDSLRGYVLIVGVEYIDGTKWSAPEPPQATP